MNLKKTVIVVMSALLLAGCFSQPEKKNEAISFTDDLGREVTLDQPKRTAALIGSFADIWCLAGGRDTLCAAANDTWTSFDLDLPDTVQDLGPIKSPNSEILVGSDPDFVLASAKNEADLKLEDMLESADIPVAYFDVSSFEDYLRVLKICTQLTGNEQAYQTYGTDLQEEIDKDVDIARSHPSPTVLYLRATGKGVSAKGSKGTVLGDMLANLNTVNVADDDKSLLDDLSVEAILQADPQYIFIVYQGSDDSKARARMEEDLLKDSAWQNLSAVKEGRVYVMDQTLYNLKPNARWAQAYTDLTNILYG